MRTHVESADHRGQGKIALAEHFQWLELVIARAILEFHSNNIIAGGILGQLESNSRGVVGCAKL